MKDMKFEIDTPNKTLEQMPQLAQLKKKNQNTNKLYTQNNQNLKTHTKYSSKLITKKKKGQEPRT